MYWLTQSQVAGMHGEQLAIFQGAPGLRDFGMLGSALDRARNKWAHGERDPARLAAAYAFAVTRDMPFVAGNRRSALLCMLVFLHRNGIDFDPDEAEATAAMQELAAGNIDEDGLSRWIRDNWPK